jgi:hypothetical protein
LPGKSPEQETSSADLPVQTISFQQSSTPTNNGVKLPKFGSNRDWDNKDYSNKPRMRTTTIEVPRDASLVRRKSKERLTLELGAADADSQPSEIYPSSGVSVGGNAGNDRTSMPSSPAVQSLPAVNSQHGASAAQPSTDGPPEALPAAKLRSLPPPSPGGKSPFAHRPLPKSSNFVRQASFFERQAGASSNR